MESVVKLNEGPIVICAVFGAIPACSLFTDVDDVKKREPLVAIGCFNSQVYNVFLMSRTIQKNLTLTSIMNHRKML